MMNSILQIMFMVSNNLNDELVGLNVLPRALKVYYGCRDANDVHVFHGFIIREHNPQDNSQ